MVRVQGVHRHGAADMSMEAFNLVCTKAEGRDKLARFFQFGARAIAGFIGMAARSSESPLTMLDTHCRTAMVQLAMARRTHRWCKEIPVIQSIPKCLCIACPVERTLQLLQKASLAAFMVIDHVGLLKQWKLLPGGKRSGMGTIQLGLKSFCFSSCVAALSQAKRLLELSRAGEGEEERQRCREALLKHLLLVLQVAHLSLLWPTHDALVGVAGMATSLLDLKPHWPERRRACCADAKGKAR